MSAPKLPGLTHEQQKDLELAINAALGRWMVANDSVPPDAARAGLAEWAMRFAMRHGLLDEPRVIVRKAGGKRR